MPWRSLSVMIYTVYEDRVLLHFDHLKERWGAPEGALNDHELPEEAAIRIGKEQLGVDVEHINARQLLGEHLMLVDPIAMLTAHVDGEHEMIHFVFAVRISGPVPEGVDWLDIKWFSREDLKTEPVLESVRVCAAKALESAEVIP